jgi:hypothetical protein
MIKNIKFKIFVNSWKFQNLYNLGNVFTKNI